MPKSKLREAIGYFCGLIPYMKNYTQQAFSRIDNNVRKRAIRPLAKGRKNWLFFGSPDGGETSAILFSLVQTAVVSALIQENRWKMSWAGLGVITVKNFMNFSPMNG